MEVGNKIQILPLRPTVPEVSAGVAKDKPTATKRSRTSKPKVRTGCMTCKIRRVKCDETKPECDRCTNTGRKCDGYIIIPRKNQAGSKAVSTGPSSESSGFESPPERALGLSLVSQNELQALEFFHSRTGPGLSVYFDSDFWTRLVIQMSMAEPSIKHAMMAVGSLHKQRETGPSTVSKIRVVEEGTPIKMALPASARTDADHNDRFALTHYNKAIYHLSEHLQKSKPDSTESMEVALLACILFVCVEFLRGDVEPAIKHFQSGMSIAMSAFKSAKSTNGMASIHRMNQYMMPFFNRLELLSMLFGNETPWEYPVELLKTVPKVFSSLNEARNSIVHLMNYNLRFIRFMRFRKHAPDVAFEDIARQQELLNQLESWKSSFDLMVLTKSLTQKEQDAGKVLIVHYIITVIWQSNSCDDLDTTHDGFISMFDTAITLAEAYQANQKAQEQIDPRPTTFLFDMEIVSPMYYVAIKCRHPQIRRRAIALLKGMDRREGLWDSNMAAAIASRMVEIEEANLTTLDGSELPVETDRVHNVQITSMVGLRPGSHSVTFHMQPGGNQEPWNIWNETIIVE